MGPDELNYATFETAAGWMAVLGSPEGLRRTVLPCPAEEEAVAGLGKFLANAKHDPAGFRDVIAGIQAYFNGAKTPLDFALDFAGGTAFQVRVWQETIQIPYGETRSYGWLAARAGSPGAARAVGHAMAHNPLPIVVPCHRVIGADGSLCGFGGGLPMKKYLLALEARGPQ